MQKMITDYIRAYVKEECSKTQFTQELYENHILVVADYGAKLSRLLGADSLIVELSSYLHDFSTVHNFEHKHDHNIKGAKKVQELLRQFKFSDQVIEQVSNTIIENSKSSQSEKTTKEAICLFNAEAMSLIGKPIFWLYYSNSLNKKPYKDNLKAYLNWMEAYWINMIDAAKDMMAEEYKFLKVLKNK